MAVLALADEVHRVISTAVDGSFYRAVNPDLAEANVDPIRHYADIGWREGRDPAPWFSTEHYVKANPDVARRGWNPLHHYLVQGRGEGREVVPSRWSDDYLIARTRRGLEPAWSFESLTGGSGGAVEVADEAQARLFERTLVAGEFDAAYYLSANPDVKATGADPLDHFLSSGWREGRDPTPRFSVRDYLETYPDIAAAGVNPFAHYLTVGRTEGRIERNKLGFRYEIIKRLAPLDKRVAAVARASGRMKLATAPVLAKALAGARTGLADLHITFSHDDYTTNTGGVQLCLQREGARIAALGRDHLHIHPAKPWPVVRLGKEAGHLGVVFNGQPVGVFAPKVVASVLKKAAGAKIPGRRSFAVHSLLGHSADETAAIVEAAGLRAGYFWTHDFASLCAGYHLMRNDVEDCAAPPPESAACGICVYGPWRQRHLAEHGRLFDRLDLTVVSPSQPTLDLWRASWSFPAKARSCIRTPAWWTAGLRPRRRPVGRCASPSWACPCRTRAGDLRGSGAAVRRGSPLQLPAPGRPYAGRPAAGLPQGDGHRRRSAGHAGHGRPAGGGRGADLADLSRDLLLHRLRGGRRGGRGGHRAGQRQRRGLRRKLRARQGDAGRGGAGGGAGNRRDRRPGPVGAPAQALRPGVQRAHGGSAGDREVKVLCYSSFTFSYLNRARVLFQTLRRFHPDWELVALVTDRPPAGFLFDPARSRSTGWCGPRTWASPTSRAGSSSTTWSRSAPR